MVSLLFVGLLLYCQKTVLTIINAIPTGIKAPILPPTAPTMIKRIPLMEKSSAAALIRFVSFIDSLIQIDGTCFDRLNLSGVKQRAVYFLSIFCFTLNSVIFDTISKGTGSLNGNLTAPLETS